MFNIILRKFKDRKIIPVIYMLAACFIWIMLPVPTMHEQSQAL
jgi:hypothetical protein